MILTRTEESRARLTGLHARILAATLVLCVAAPTTVLAQRGIPIARDAETEAMLKSFLKPLVKAAGINMPKVNLVPAHDFNAFVTPGRKIFVNSGTIIASETPNELNGVLAHEIAHLANNDPAQIQQVIADTSNVMMLAGLLGLGAAAAASAAGAKGAAQAGAGIFSGIGSVGTRSILRYKRSQEAAADLSAAKYLHATGQSAAGMLVTLERLSNQNLFISQQVSPYLMSHPLPRDRAATIRNLAAKSKYYGSRDSANAIARYKLVQAKLVGFTMDQGEVYRRFPRSDQSLAGRYARAISEYRAGRPKEAYRQIDQLIALAPNYPYFYELKGQALLEGGRPKAAVSPLRRAVKLSNSGLINIMLGQALVAVGSKASAKEAIKVLRIGIRDAPRAQAGYTALARAYAITGDVPMAQLTTAEGMLRAGRLRDAKIQATRAQAKLKRGSPAWLRADDIVSYNP